MAKGIKFTKRELETYSASIGKNRALGCGHIGVSTAHYESRDKEFLCSKIQRQRVL